MPPFPLPNWNLRYPIVNFTTDMGRGPICSSGQEGYQYHFFVVLTLRLARASSWKQAITPQQSSSFAFHFLRTIQSDHLRSTLSPTSFILLSHSGTVCSPWHQGLRLGGTVLISRSSAVFRAPECPLLTTHRPQTKRCPHLRCLVLCEDSFQKACTRQLQGGRLLEQRGISVRVCRSFLTCILNPLKVVGLSIKQHYTYTHI